MKRICRFSSVILVVLLLASLFGCGDQPSNDTTAPPQTTQNTFTDLTGATFTADPVWRSNKTVLQVPNTFEAWINLPAGSSGKNDVVISTAGDAYEHECIPCVTLYVDSNGVPVLDWVCDKELSYSWRFDDVNLRTGEWTHLAVVRDVEAGRIFCYVNGQNADLYKERFSMDIAPVTAYCIGGDHTAKNENFFTGQIHNVAVFSSARTPEQIAEDMNTPAGDDLLLYYQMDSADNGKIKDLSANGFDLIQSVRWLSEKAPVTDYAYSFMVVPDTQIVAVADPDNFHMIYDYIIENVKSKNVQYVIGLGDITGNSTSAEWDVAKNAIFKMDGVVPYSVARGNSGHDSIKEYNAAFLRSKYQGMIKGSFENDMRNVYHTFEVGAVKYLLLVLDCAPTDEMVQWASDVIAANPDRNVILTTHMYLRKDGTPLPDADCGNAPNSGVDLWENLVRKHENIVLVLCGHHASSQLVLSQNKGDHGNTVSQLLINGQGVEECAEGSCGFVATLYFSEDGKDVTVEYYSTIKEKYFLTENQFSFSLDLIDP